MNLKDENREPLEGVGLNANGLEKEVYTDESGHALLPDLQTYEKTIVTIDDETLPDIALYPEKEEQKLVLRPGTIRTVDNIKCANHWRQPVESELTADFQSDWQAQLGGNGDTSGVSRMVLHLNEFDDDYEYKLSEKRAEDLGVESVSDDEDIQQKAAQELEEIEMTEQKSVNDEEFNVSQEPETEPQEFNVSQEPEAKPQEFNVSQEPEAEPQEFNGSQEPETKPQEFNVSHKGQEKTKNFHVSMLNQ